MYHKAGEADGDTTSNAFKSRQRCALTGLALVRVPLSREAPRSGLAPLPLCFLTAGPLALLRLFGAGNSRTLRFLALRSCGQQREFNNLAFIRKRPRANAVSLRCGA